MALPMLAGVLTIPGLIHRLGHDSFGILALAWALVGYFGFLDFGLGKALTFYLSSAQQSGTPQAQQATVARATRRLLIAFSFLLTLIIWFIFPFVLKIIEMPLEVRNQASSAAAMIAISVPLSVWIACSSGVLEARSRFAVVNSIRIPTGIGNFMAPWLASTLTTDLFWIISSMVAVRFFGALGMAWWARTEFHHASSQWPARQIQELLRFGKWLTVSNVIGPLMSYFDRFAIAAWTTAAAVTHYTIPFDVISRLPVIPIAIMAVLLPLMAKSFTNEPNAIPQQTIRIRKTINILLICWIPSILVLSWTGSELLKIWVGSDLAAVSGPIWRWLAVGILVNGLAHFPLTILQSSGRTDVIAKIHLIEIIPYAIGLWWALRHYGVLGAAVLWTIRASIDFLLVTSQAMKIFPEWRNYLWHPTLWGSMGATVALWIANQK